MRNLIQGEMDPQNIFAFKKASTFISTRGKFFFSFIRESGKSYHVCGSLSVQIPRASNQP